MGSIPFGDSLILPYPDYCRIVWGCIGNGLSQKLEKLQSALKWESLTDRHAKQLKLLMFDKFTSINTIYRHNLWGTQHNLFIPRTNTEALKKSLCYRGVVTWNSLSVKAKQATKNLTQDFFKEKILS